MRNISEKIIGVFSLCLVLILVVVAINNIQLKTQRKVEIGGDYYAFVVDGEDSFNLPQAGVYLIDYTCDNNSKIEWDRSTGKLSLSKNTSISERCSLTFKTNPLVSELSQGSYIAYEGNNGCLRDGVSTANIMTSGQGQNENSNSCLGYNANANSDGSRDLEYEMYGYCSTESNRYYVSGWRIAYTKDNRAYIISAGSPECTIRRAIAGNVDYITDANIDAKKYCNSRFVDDCTSDEDVHAINEIDYNSMTSQATGTVGGYFYIGVSGGGFQCPYYVGAVCGCNNDLIHNGGIYWFAAAVSDYSAEGVFWSTYKVVKASDTSTKPYGLRPVIRLSSSVYVTGGSGTPEDPYTIAK